MTEKTLARRYVKGERVFAGEAFEFADFRGAKLSGADFSGANFSNANLCGANLENCILTNAILNHTNLGGSSLKGVNARRADFRAANLGWTSLDASVLDGAIFAGTSFCNVNLAEASLIDTIHRAPSTVGTDTIQRTASNCPQSELKQYELIAFLEGCGVHQFIIEYFKNCIVKRKSYYSTFISYSHDDRLFARKLHNALQSNGVRCWYDEEMKLGDPIQEMIQHAMRKQEKVLLCCSRASLNSSWVATELAWAVFEETIRSEHVLIPLDLDGYLATWNGPLANTLKNLLTADCQHWHDDSVFQGIVQKIIFTLEKAAK